MGNWLALELLRQMAIRNGGLPAKFKNIMLASPDVDVDVFRSQIADMGTQHPKFTLFVSQDDRALAVSRRVWGDVARLGSIDPETGALQAGACRKSDHRHRPDQGQIRGQAQSWQIRRVARDRSADRRPASPKVSLLPTAASDFGDRIVTATAGAAAVAGTAAGLAIAAPVAVVDQNTRDNYANQVGSSGVSMPAGSRARRQGQQRLQRRQGCGEQRMQALACSKGKGGCGREGMDAAPDERSCARS